MKKIMEKMMKRIRDKRLQKKGMIKREKKGMVMVMKKTLILINQKGRVVRKFQRKYQIITMSLQIVYQVYLLEMERRRKKRKANKNQMWRKKEIGVGGKITMEMMG